ncbi:response regulator transcription factor [bacterium SCSIO 12643]|nr:response regulator transcription factor [bacterium SCSIO 12643]
MIKAIIIEDESLARQRLYKLLQPYSNQIEIIDEAVNGGEGLQKVEALQPDLIFLDIQMPVLNGFEMLMKLSVKPYIVFTTAYDEYAIQAFEENSIDYLLKPIRPERLEVTMSKISRLKPESQTFDHQSIQTLLQHLHPPKVMRSITVSLGDKITIVNLNDIVLFQAEDKLTTVYTVDQKKHLISQSLSQLEKKLPEHFMRLNRSSIINEHEIHEIRKGFNGKLVFEMKHINQMKITTGSSYTAAIKERLKF